MKRTNVNQQSERGFTIIELLTVMSIIVILISLLTPALNRVRRYSTDVKQRAQFHSIGVALDLFSNENEGYPPSNAEEPNCLRVDTYYGGAMKLAEAMVGQDLKGFNPASRFERRGFCGALTAGWDGMPYPPYNTYGATANIQLYNENVRSRKMNLELERANAYMLRDIYDTAAISTVSAAIDPNTYVLCDSYNRVTNKSTGKKIGMPILYYKADSGKMAFPRKADTSAIIDPLRCTYIYNSYDNQQLINIGIPWMATTYDHPMGENGHTTPDGVTVDSPKKFYDIIRDSKISDGDKPYKADSYILISAGFDGQYGTKDDIYNFSD
jgi:prepilin-type N-terminal cleavage/methylation domain-containing protein